MIQGDCLFQKLTALKFAEQPLNEGEIGMAMGIYQSWDQDLTVNIDDSVRVCRCRVSGRRFDSGYPTVTTDSNSPVFDDTVVFIDGNDCSVEEGEGIHGLSEPVIY
jgi:hypothetical protein